MDLYHTTSGTELKQEIAQRYSTRLDLAQTKVAILPSSPPGACLGAATERRASIQVMPAARQIQPMGLCTGSMYVTDVLCGFIYVGA